MVKILDPKIEASGLLELGLLGASKVFMERVTSPMVGNASIKSGGLKLIGGVVVSSLLPGKLGKIAGGGLMIDGVEDIALTFLGGVGAPTQDAW